MSSEDLSIARMIEVGVHFGHKTSYWNPQMSPYIYGSTRNGVHVIDLRKSYAMFKAALAQISKVAQDKGRILFVGTKMQASQIIEEEASRCGQYYVNHTWLGGTLTNWATVSSSINRLAQYEKALESTSSTLTKKELSGIDKKRVKLDRVFRGIRSMGGLPDVLFVIDAKNEHVAIKEANRLSIPVIAVVDTNASPQGVEYIIPGNDDSTKSIHYYCRLVSNAVLSGIKRDLASSGLSLNEGTRAKGEEFATDQESEGLSADDADSRGRSARRGKAGGGNPAAGDGDVAVGKVDSNTKLGKH